ncbi:hypothetical protein [Roseiarcus fermentans]|uniref:hypothetical protein n=1 Tax=Roseiarcus fermentans TaxID=1473586 RepID=UPI0011BEB461|nr:hypothetical protein [Roseiarcus fermentans]
MKTFEFTIVASSPGSDIADLSERLFEAGCDDATVSLQKGAAIIEFDRESRSFYHALKSALRDVESTGAMVLYIAPEHLVSLSDIASRIGITRAAVSNYAIGKRDSGDFPIPVVRVTTDTPLWDWVDVARWFFRRGRLSLTQVVHARVVRYENVKRLKRSEHMRAA